MFGRGKSKAKAQKPQDEVEPTDEELQQQIAIANRSVREISKRHSADMGEVQVSDADLNDPALLAELEQFGFEGTVPAPKKAPTSNPPANSSGIKVTNKDLKDPKLMAELRAAGWEDEDEEDTGDTALLGEMSARAAEYKAAALAYKKAGDVAGAKECLKTMKAIQSAMEVARVGGSVPPLPGPPPRPGSAPTSQQAVPRQASAQPRPATAPAPPKDDSDEEVQITDADLQDPALLAELAAVTGGVSGGGSSSKSSNSKVKDLAADQKMLEERISQYKRAAIDHKKAGRMTEAKQMVHSYSRILQPILEKVKSSGKTILELGVEVPPPPEMGTAASQTISAGDSAVEKERLRIFDVLLEELKVCLERSERGVKEAVARNNQADIKAREVDVNRLKSDIRLVMHLRSKPGAELPKYRLERSSHMTERVNYELAEGEVEITIVKSLGVRRNNHPTTHFIKYDWELGQEEPITVQTSAIKAESPEFNHRKLFPIVRGRNSTTRFFEKKKVVMEVWKKKGIFQSDELIGKCVLRMEWLLEHTDLKATLDINDERRKPTGAQLEVHVRLRTPLCRPEMIDVVESMVVLEDTARPDSLPPSRAGSPTPSSAATAPAGNPTKKAPSVVSDAGSSRTAPPASGGSKGKATEKQKQKQKQGATSSIMEKYELDPPDAVSNHVSAAVLEWEIEQCQAGVSKGNTAAATRLADAQIALQTLQLTVQSGMLSFEDYLAKVKTRIGEEKTIALDMKKCGRKDQALLAMKRIKIMNEEYNEAMAASSG